MKAGAMISLLSAGAVAAGCVDSPGVGPYLQGVTRGTVTLAWEIEDPSESLVEYGPTAGYGQTVSSPLRAALHEITLTGLSPDTLYHYRVVSGGVAGLDHTFRTAPDESSPFRFAVYGDTQSNADVHARVAQGMMEEDPRLVLHTGDEVDDGTDHDAWLAEFFGPAMPLMAEVPVYVAIGNHEHDSRWFYYYHAYPLPEDYYAFTYGNSTFVVLDTNRDFSPGSPQHAWLVETLSSPEAQAAQWRFVAHHHPAYTEGWRPCDYDGDPEVRDYLVPLMEEHGVDVVFNGHTHGYARGFLNGVTYIITGGGGGRLDQDCMDWPHIAVSAYVHHFVTVDIDGPSLVLNAHGDDGQIFDTYSLMKEVQP